jgi:hypothetical protein
MMNRAPWLRALCRTILATSCQSTPFCVGVEQAQIADEMLFIVAS